MSTPAIIIFKVTVDSSNKYLIDGKRINNLTTQSGKSYSFDLSDSTMDQHPLLFSKTLDGLNTSGSTIYENDIKYIIDGSIKNTNDYLNSFQSATSRFIEFKSSLSEISLYSFCKNHSEMGFKIINDYKILAKIDTSYIDIDFTYDSYRFTQIREINLFLLESKNTIYNYINGSIVSSNQDITKSYLSGINLNDKGFIKFGNNSYDIYSTGKTIWPLENIEFFHSLRDIIFQNPPGPNNFAKNTSKDTNIIDKLYVSFDSPEQINNNSVMFSIDSIKNFGNISATNTRSNDKILAFGLTPYIHTFRPSDFYNQNLLWTFNSYQLQEIAKKIQLLNDSTYKNYKKIITQGNGRLVNYLHSNNTNIQLDTQYQLYLYEGLPSFYSNQKEDNFIQLQDMQIILEGTNIPFLDFEFYDDLDRLLYTSRLNIQGDSNVEISECYVQDGDITYSDYLDNAINTTEEKINYAFENSKTNLDSNSYNADYITRYNIGKLSGNSFGDINTNGGQIVKERDSNGNYTGNYIMSLSDSNDHPRFKMIKLKGDNNIKTIVNKGSQYDSGLFQSLSSKNNGYYKSLNDFFQDFDFEFTNNKVTLSNFKNNYRIKKMKIKSNTHSTFNYVNILDTSKSFNSAFNNIDKTSLKIYKDNILVHDTIILESDFNTVGDYEIFELDNIQNNIININLENLEQPGITGWSGFSEKELFLKGRIITYPNNKSWWGNYMVPHGNGTIKISFESKNPFYIRIIYISADNNRHLKLKIKRSEQQHSDEILYINTTPDFDNFFSDTEPSEKSTFESINYPGSESLINLELSNNNNYFPFIYDIQIIKMDNFTISIPSTNQFIQSSPSYILSDPQNVKTLEVRRATIEIPFLTQKFHDDRNIFTISNNNSSYNGNKFIKVQFPAIIYKVKDSETSSYFTKENIDNSVYILYHVDYDANAANFDLITYTYYFTILEFSQQGNFVNYKKRFTCKNSFDNSKFVVDNLLSYLLDGNHSTFNILLEEVYISNNKNIGPRYLPISQSFENKSFSLLQSLGNSENTSDNSELDNYQSIINQVNINTSGPIEHPIALRNMDKISFQKLYNELFKPQYNTNNSQSIRVSKNSIPLTSHQLSKVSNSNIYIFPSDSEIDLNSILTNASNAIYCPISTSATSCQLAIGNKNYAFNNKNGSITYDVGNEVFQQDKLIKLDNYYLTVGSLLINTENNETPDVYINTIQVLQHEGEDKYFINGSYNDVFFMDNSSKTYIFDLSASSLENHPLLFSKTQDGIHTSGGTVFTNGVQYIINGSAVDQQNYLNNFHSATSRSIKITTSEYETILYTFCNNNADIGFMLVSNLTSGQGAGAGADPYVITLTGDFYKMKNFDGFVRMLQCEYNGKTLTINIETLYSTDAEKDELINYLIQAFNKLENDNISLETLKNTVYNCPNEAFMRKIFINYGEDYIIIDLMNHDIIENNSGFKIINKENEKCFLDLSHFNHYSDVSYKNAIIDIDGLKVILSIYSNPQIRTSFHIENPLKILKPVGAIVKPLPVINFKIEDLDNLEKIENISEKRDNSYVEEYYLDRYGNEKILKIDVL